MNERNFQLEKARLEEKKSQEETLQKIQRRIFKQESLHREAIYNHDKEIIILQSKLREIEKESLIRDLNMAEGIKKNKE